MISGNVVCCNENVFLQDSEEKMENHVDSLEQYDSRENHGNDQGPQTMTLTQIMQQGLFNPCSGLFHDPVSGNNFSLGAAIKHGLIDARKSLFKLPQTGEIIDLQEAIQSGAVNSKTGNVFDYVKGEEIPLHVAVRRKLVSDDSEIVSGRSFSISTADESLTFQDRIKGGKLSFPCNVTETNFEETISIRDKKSGSVLSLKDARKNSIVKFIESDMSSTKVGMKGCFVKDTFNDKWLSWDKACDAGLVGNLDISSENSFGRRDSKQIKRVTWSTFKETEEESTNEDENLDSSKDESESELDMEVAAALRAKNKRKHSIELCSMSDLPVTLDDVIDNGLYDPVTNTVQDISTDECVPFAEAIERGLVHKASLIRDPVSKDILTLEEAIDKRIIDPLSGRMMLSSGLPIALNFAVNRGLVVKCKSPFCLSLSEAIEEGLFDLATGMLLNPDTEEKMGFSQAIFSGMLDCSIIKVRDVDSGEVLGFQEAVEKDLLNLATGMCYDTSSGDTLSLIESIERGILIDLTNQPKYSLLEVVDDCLVDNQGRFHDPSTGYEVTLISAIDSSLLDRDCVLVRDLESQTLLTLDGALNEGIVDSLTGVYKCGKTTCDFNTAVSKGLLIQNLGSTDLNLIDAVHEGVYNATLQHFMDPRNGEVKTFLEAMESNLICCDDIVVKNSKTAEYLTFEEAVSRKLIDLVECHILDTVEGDWLDLKEALARGLLRQTIAEPAKGLVSIVAEGVYDVELQRVRDKSSQMCVDVEDAISIGIVDPSHTYVRDNARNQFIPLSEAISYHLMDRYSGKVTDTKTFEKLDLCQAVEKHLVIEMPDRGFTLVDVLANDLYDKDKHTILHPHTCVRMTLEDAISCRLVDGSQPQVLVAEQGIFSPKEAIARKILDPETVTYLEHTSFPDAVAKGFIFKSERKGYQPFLTEIADILKDSDFTSMISSKQTTDTGFVGHSDFAQRSNYGKPLFGIQRAVEECIFEKHRCTFYDLRVKTSVTMADALKTFLIHGTRSRVMNPDSRKFISLSEAVEKGIVSGKTGSILDRQNMKSIPLEKAVEENLVVDVPFTRVTLDEALFYGLLNSNTLKMQSMITDERPCLADAINKGLIDAEDTLVKDIDKDMVMTLRKAVDCGLFNTTTGCVVCDSGRIINLVDAVNEGFILNGRSLCNFPRLPHLGKRSLQLDSSSSGEVVSKQPKHSSDSSGIDIPENDDMLDLTDDNMDVTSFGEALRRNCLDLETCTFCMSEGETPVPLAEAISQGLLDISGVTFHDRITNQNLSLKLALDVGLLDLTDEKRKYGDSRQGMTFKEAFDEGLLVERMQVNLDEPEMTDHRKQKQSWTDKLERGADVIKAARNMSSSLDSLLQVVKDDQGTYRLGTLHRILRKGILNAKTGLMDDLITGKPMTIQDAVQSGLINMRAKEIVDPRTRELLTLQEAISLRVVDPVKGTYQDTVQHTTMSLKEAMDLSLVIEGLPEPLEPKSAVEIYVEEILANEQNKGKVKLQEAFSSGVLHRSNSTVIDPDTIQPITLKRAASLGMIDMSTGEFKNPQTGECISLSDAVEKGFILSPKGLTLYSAVNQGLYSDKNCQFVDPGTGKEHTLKEMIEMEIITPLCLEIRDLTKNGIVVTLQTAIDSKTIEQIKNVYINLVTNQVYNFNEAIAAGLIMSSSPREGLRESNNSQSIMSTSGMHTMDSNRFRLLAENAYGPVLTRPFSMGSRSRNSSSSDLTTDSSGTDRKDPHTWMVPLSSEMIRQMIVNAKQKKDAAAHKNGSVDQEKLNVECDTGSVMPTMLDEPEQVAETNGNVTHINSVKEGSSEETSKPASMHITEIPWQQEVKVIDEVRVKPAMAGLRKVGMLIPACRLPPGHVKSLPAW